jgi:Domain of unknown function (DUF4263)
MSAEDSRHLTGSSGRAYEIRTSSRGIDYLRGVLREKATVTTQALFWKIPRSGDRFELALKIGRYVRRKGELTLHQDKPRSELTLDGDELDALRDFMADNVEPLQSGARSYLVLDDTHQQRVEAVRELLASPDQQQLIDLLIAENLVPDDVRRALEHRSRCDAIADVEQMLEQDLREVEWQRWFELNDRVLGSDFVRLVGERPIDVAHIADYLLQAYDGFLDIVELKRPEGSLRFWAEARDHGNLVPHADLVKAITQAQRYLFEIEREANSVKFTQRVGVPAVKPRCTLIMGRSASWDAEHREAYRILNAGYHNLSVMTYDHVVTRAKRMVGLPVKQPDL